MLTEEFVISNPLGLHAKPAVDFSNLAKRFESRISIVKEGAVIDAKDVFTLMGSELWCGIAIRLVAEGRDELEAMRVLGDFIRALKD